MYTADLPRLEFSEDELLQARIELTAFVQTMAHQTAERLGFGWITRPDAPNTWKDLKAAWQHSLATSEPLPVFDGGSDSVVFTSADANYAYRFWHDVTHLERGRNFTSPHELGMAAFHLWEAERHGLERGSLPWRLLHADAVGQVLHWAVLREYVVNQDAFVHNYLQFGGEEALLAEMARSGLLRPQVLPVGIDIATDATTPTGPTHWKQRPTVANSTTTNTPPGISSPHLSAPVPSPDLPPGTTVVGSDRIPHNQYPARPSAASARRSSISTARQEGDTQS